MIKEIENTKYEMLIDWLKQSRLDKNLTIRELAALIDEPFQFVSKVENCQRRLNVYEYVQYCKALEVSPNNGIELLSTPPHKPFQH